MEKDNDIKFESMEMIPRIKFSTQPGDNNMNYNYFKFWVFAR